MRRLVRPLAVATMVVMLAPTPAGAPISNVFPYRPALPEINLAPEPTPAPSVPPSHHRLLHGKASTYGDNYGIEYLAVPVRDWRGHNVRVCHDDRCIVQRVTDHGPNQIIFPERVVDLPVGAFEYLCDCEWRVVGILSDVTVELDDQSVDP